MGTRVVRRVVAERLAAETPEIAAYDDAATAEFRSCVLGGRCGEGLATL
jgi:hypothetical protein